ncbi:DUF4355 domain-containing protein [Bifidobacterium samirii]|uniref:Uncharacterized protein n=1 Tax=Bifidobacterium samirii TaxID=2306974 RepID=A0A430FUE2_9BIFI|nr:DUF4355 domain-containing protein [Bifidobacterium samirii]RSX56766.1 hypothetical protein D2E24_1056 [Bifidobacterium samirii]
MFKFDPDRKPWYMRMHAIRPIEDPAAAGGSDPGDPNGGDPDPAAPAGHDPDDPLGEGGMKALKAERETNRQLKAQIAQLAEQVKAFEDKDKTEAQKQAEALQAATATAAEATLKATRYEVAAAKGIPLDAAARLRGATREEMEADADDLLRLLDPDRGEGRNPDPPKPDPSQGKGGDPRPSSLADAISRHYK